MARGWESKSIASQMQDAGGRRRSRDKKPPTPAELERVRKRDSLMLERARVLQELETSRNPRYRAMLEQSLEYVNGELGKLQA